MQKPFKKIIIKMEFNQVSNNNYKNKIKNQDIMQLELIIQTKNWDCNKEKTTKNLV